MYKLSRRMELKGKQSTILDFATKSNNEINAVKASKS